MPAKRGPGRPRKSQSEPSFVIAKHAFVTEHDGQEVLIAEGARLDATNPIAKAHEDSFRPDEPEADI